MGGGKREVLALNGTEQLAAAWLASIFPCGSARSGAPKHKGLYFV